MIRPALCTRNAQKYSVYGVMVILGAICSLGACTDRWSELEPRQQSILIKYFDPDHIRKCDVRVDNITYSTNISGTIGMLSDEHGPSLVFLDETSPLTAEDPAKGTPIFEPMWREGADFRPPSIQNVGETSSWKRRQRMKGWIVSGKNECLHSGGWRSDRFILVIDYGFPVGKIDERSATVENGGDGFAWPP